MMFAKAMKQAQTLTTKHTTAWRTKRSSSWWWWFLLERDSFPEKLIGVEAFWNFGARSTEFGVATAKKNCTFGKRTRRRTLACIYMRKFGGGKFRVRVFK